MSDRSHDLSSAGNAGPADRERADPALPALARLPLWPVLIGLVLVVALAAAMVLGLARSGAATLFGGTGDTEESLNWAGYLVSHGRFSSVTATWVVPVARDTTGPGAAASFWVGLSGRDGHSLEQLGTTSAFTGLGPRYGVWWEMLPGPAVDAPMTVAPGDAVTATVTSDGRGAFTLRLRDATNGQRFAITQTDALAAPTSAEVVTEAPSSSSGQVPLADFGTVRFSHVRVNGRPLGALHWSKVNMVIDGRRQADASALSAGASGFAVSWSKR
jgi:Peptidase A4 family